MKSFSFKDISEIPLDDRLPLLDRRDCRIEQLTEHQKQWRENGVLILEKFLPDDLIAKYSNCWLASHAEQIVKGVKPDGTLDTVTNIYNHGGWPDCVPYMRHPEVKEIGLYPPLMAKLKQLIGDDMGMHLNLTGWVSTQRNWHQDDYLNPDFVYTWYAAVWMALGDVDPDSGPFEYVPGSHRWPLTRRSLLFRYMPQEWQTDHRWPQLSQDAVSQAFEEEIQRRKAKVCQFIAKKGDVLIWHGRLAHRGSQPKNPDLLRKAFISHYSALSRRQDMPNRKQHEGGGWYFELEAVNPTMR